MGIIAIAGYTKTETAASADSSKPGTAAAATPAAPSASDARHAVDSMNTAMASAMARGDSKAISAMYASNAILDAPGAPLMSGADAISKNYDQMLSGVTLQGPAIHTDDVMTGGDLVVENGTWSWTAQPKTGGKAQAQKGHYLTVWQRQPDGAWKIVRDYVTADPAAE